MVEDDPQLSEELQVLWDLTAEESRLAAARMERLARLWVDTNPDDYHPDDDVDIAALQAAAAQRSTVGVAQREVGDAHTAVVDLPRIFARLASGELPLAWMQRVLRVARSLSPQQLAELDEVVSGWDLHITCERFRRDLRHLAALLRSRSTQPEHEVPEALRRVEVFPTDAEGMACLQVHGPAPEIIALGKRLDSAARAVQAAQRRALDQASPVVSEMPVIPFDDGTVRERGRAMPLARLRYSILTDSILDTGAVQVPTERFRINVTVPAMTLLGASEAPATLDGTVPLPAPLARHLAGGEDTWYRVLTDPSSGAFLPLPAQRYVPTAAMREHLRLRTSTCAVPGCTRSSSWASECDHIQEYNHHHPESGGLTDVENLHLLCWQHHQLKTNQRIDPERLPRPPGELGPGTTRWRFSDGTIVDARDDVDLMTPVVIHDLMEHWREHTICERQRAAQATAGNAPGDTHPPPPF